MPWSRPTLSTTVDNTEPTFYIELDGEAHGPGLCDCNDTCTECGATVHFQGTAVGYMTYCEKCGEQ